MLALVVVAAGFSQEKFVESYGASDEMVVTVNTSHTNVIFETWNKDKVEVEAFIEGESLTKAEKQQLFDDWKFNVLGNSKNVVITSNGKNSNWEGISSLSSLESLGNLEFLGPLIENALTPVINGVSSPEFTETIMRSVSNIDFNYEEYKKDEEGYMKKFEAKMDKNFGKDFERDMEKWGKKMEQEYQERFGPEWEAKMEEWGNKFGKDMEQWGEQFGKEMEKWGEQFGESFGENMEESMKELEKSIERGMNGGNSNTTIIRNDENYIPKVKRTIIIRMPKNTKTVIDVRHGEIKMADAFNVKATLNHTPFTAERIDGGKTLINAAYAPVIVKDWKFGTLYVKFVEKCDIGNVESIQLNANSSDVKITAINKEAFLTGSFGALVIGKISNDFKTLEIVLRNTDAAVSLPNTSFSFLFNGKRSTLKYPKSLQLTSEKQNERVLVKGFNSVADKSKNFRINAEYSNLILQ
ncbi:hypothetical protein ULMS_23390 [Patiriisocius marinistellae]|uniref:Uncharacterized protein n=2 Tax=Patiriisocius marinistellae TaxID=2494560 RepID=A0A5J4G3B4_9FLAO|nr:hypothetical protein ULMS_23390 [Patiriisocius marinistellae]